MINKTSKIEEKPKINYAVTLEILAPVTLTYNIVAENEDEALQLMEKKLLSPDVITKPKISLMRKLKAIVRLRGMINIMKIKNYIK
jgi:hypothetical protein